MQNNRPTRSMQQVRALLQTMGRSIDEARTRRLGPVATPEGDGASAEAARSEAPAPRAQPAAPNSTPAPPVRNASEMFAEAAPRLKARPKRAS
ncbi:MAG: hypothetical protein RIS86_1220 [Planctomycetota bacterium]